MSNGVSMLEVFLAAVVDHFSTRSHAINGVALYEHCVSAASKTEHESLLLAQSWLHLSGLWCSP
jgi:hypothetical protein